MVVGAKSLTERERGDRRRREGGNNERKEMRKTIWLPVADSPSVSEFISAIARSIHSFTTIIATLCLEISIKRSLLSTRIGQERRQFYSELLDAIPSQGE